MPPQRNKVPTDTFGNPLRDEPLFKEIKEEPKGNPKPTGAPKEYQPDLFDVHEIKPAPVQKKPVVIPPTPENNEDNKVVGYNRFGDPINSKGEVI